MDQDGISIVPSNSTSRVCAVLLAHVPGANAAVSEDRLKRTISALTIVIEIINSLTMCVPDFMAFCCMHESSPHGATLKNLLIQLMSLTEFDCALYVPMYRNKEFESSATMEQLELAPWNIDGTYDHE